VCVAARRSISCWIVGARIGRAAVFHEREHRGALDLEQQMTPAGPLAAAEPTIAEIRAWAEEAGLDVAPKGRLRPDVVEAYRAATDTAQR
jgi:hypothetical protein